MTLRAALLVMAALGLAGCDPSAALPVISSAASPPPCPALGMSAAPAPVSITRAVALFDAVCGESLPGFTNASSIMAANGITVPSPEGSATVYSATQDVSFQIQDGPGQGRTCSMAFGTTDPPHVAAPAFAAFGQFVETPLGLGTIYRNTQAVVLIGGSSTQGDITYLNLRLLSER